MYKLTFWKVANNTSANEIKSIRIKSTKEIYPLSLPHNRPKGTDAILLERTDRKGQGKYDKLIWGNEKGKACEVLPAWDRNSKHVVNS